MHFLQQQFRMKTFVLLAMMALASVAYSASVSRGSSKASRDLLICAFNIKTFGKSKMADEELAEYIKQVKSAYLNGSYQFVLYMYMYLSREKFITRFLMSVCFPRLPSPCIHVLVTSDNSGVCIISIILLLIINSSSGFL